MAYDMSDQERRAFLSAGTRTAKMATTRKNGAPHVVPIWFVLDGDDVDLHDRHGTVKGKALQRDGSGRALRRRRHTTVLVRHHRGRGRPSAATKTSC